MLNKLNIKYHDIYIIILIIIILLTFKFIRNFSDKSENILLNYAEKNNIKIATILINESLNKTINEINYDNIIIIDKNNNGEIISLDFNESYSNKILYSFTNELLKNINTIETDKLNLEYFNKNDLIYYVPIGVIYNSKVLTDIGPKIPFKTSVLSSADTSIVSNIKEYGINNSLIELYLNIKLYVQVILPFTSKTLEINKQIYLERKIIQGQIPNYYGGVITSFNK